MPASFPWAEVGRAKGLGCQAGPPRPSEAPLGSRSVKHGPDCVTTEVPSSSDFHDGRVWGTFPPIWLNFAPSPRCAGHTEASGMFLEGRNHLQLPVLCWSILSPLPPKEPGRGGGLLVSAPRHIARVSSASTTLS